MPTIQEALAAGVEHHRARRLGEAERIYREVLAQQPLIPQAWHLLGLIASQVGKAEAAVSCFERALSLKADFAEAHCDLGTALGVLGRRAEAIEHYQRAVATKPVYAEAYYNLANVLHQVGRSEEAVAAYRRAVEIRPQMADGFYNLALVLHKRGQVAEAIGCLRRALELEPKAAEGQYRLATWLKEQGELAGAIEAYRRAVELRPRYVEACTDLGVALHELGRLEDALACHRLVLEWNAESWEAHNNLGTVYQDLNRLEEAVRHYERALAIKPELAEAQVNLGIIHKWLGRLEEAGEAFQRALAVKPDYAAAHVGVAKLQLLFGDFERGFARFEWRWKTGQLTPRDFPQPMWDGGALPAGATILLHSEQGFGDAIQFVRYVDVVKNANPGVRVVLECPAPLVPLFRTVRGADLLVALGEEPPSFDVHAPLLSLPRVLQTRVETIPADVPYLFAEAALVATWRERLQMIGGFRVGVNWHGRAGHLLSQRRDLPLEGLAELAKIANVRLISLQKGAGADELARYGLVHLGDDLDTAGGAFSDTAAVMMNLDLVITSDTSIAHLAGALGVPVWVGLPFSTDWRWLLERSDSPWYPTMRVFRQKSPGDWADVFREFNKELTKAVGCKPGL